MSFVPHTALEIENMLSVIGVDAIADLFSEIPASLLAKPNFNLPEAMTELETTRFMKARAENTAQVLNFQGAGAYEHFIPAAVWQLIGRGEWMTAYTPYQAEASQGTLQLIYEFQTMICELTGMPVANASMYDGASALAESALMALRLHKKATTVLVPRSVHPQYRAVLKTFLGAQQFIIKEIDFDMASGTTAVAAYEKMHDAHTAAWIIPQPNFFGQLEAVDDLCNAAKKAGALAIALVNPMALALLKPPGEWGDEGVDIVCGEAQSLGVPLNSGGPYVGFLASKMDWVRQMPGRIVGRTTDARGNAGFTLTLQAREQHIRRGKATSNICTNQGLLMAAATIYMALMGPTGLLRVAQQSHANTKKLCEKLSELSGITLPFSGAYFHERVVKLPGSSQTLLAALATDNIVAGYDLSTHYPELQNCILVCATETKTENDFAVLSQAIQKRFIPFVFQDTKG